MTKVISSQHVFITSAVLALIVSLTVTTACAQTAVSELPLSPYLDTEATTNIPFAVAMDAKGQFELTEKQRSHK